MNISFYEIQRIIIDYNKCEREIESLWAKKTCLSNEIDSLDKQITLAELYKKHLRSSYDELMGVRDK